MSNEIVILSEAMDLYRGNLSQQRPFASLKMTNLAQQEFSHNC